MKDRVHWGITKIFPGNLKRYFFKYLSSKFAKSAILIWHFYSIFYYDCPLILKLLRKCETVYKIYFQAEIIRFRGKIKPICGPVCTESSLFRFIWSCPTTYFHLDLRTPACSAVTGLFTIWSISINFTLSSEIANRELQD